MHISHSMRTLMASVRFRVTWDTAFREVITHCSQTKRRGQNGTWITQDMMDAYIKLHERGIAHSVEVWADDTLAGGLYGVETSGVFCGESMFSLQSNASKLALIWLCRNKPYRIIDCQMHTKHLERMGARFMSREEYISFLEA